MAEWLVEETGLVDRAALIDGEQILAAHIAVKSDDHPRLGAVLTARWHKPQRINGGAPPAAAILLADDEVGLGLPIPHPLNLPRQDSVREVYLPRPPAGAGPGAKLTVEVVREAVWTPRSAKLAKVRLTDAAPAAAPPLAQQLTGAPVRRLGSYDPDALEAAGWTELLEEAEHGHVERDGVRLWLDATEAMTLIDVDGTLPPERLAVAGAALVARTILRMDLAGSIGIDFPTLASKAARQAAADAFDATMTGAFERTAINGFGFMQVVRPLLRPSLLAIMASRHAGGERARYTWRAQHNAYTASRPIPPPATD